MSAIETIKSAIRDIPDFPKEGIIFKDITPLLANPSAFKATIDILKDRYKDKGITQVVGIEARGFIFASALAYALGAGTVLVRKPGKLPYKTFKQSYSLEYGTDAVEIHQDAFQAGQKIVILDDVLATGGTAQATVNLIENNFKAEIVEVAFLIELDFLKGREKIKDLPVFSILHY
ncbi:Adenine phosphoribosyltransferase [hydrothermal vent metagenome]|uniref:adenine phosphoribosyltransferase n=1 Tax=hydrothermal vent metagenome TaxID=652676 RepID=A0A3B1DKD0_9ZZZZ